MTIMSCCGYIKVAHSTNSVHQQLVPDGLVVHLQEAERPLRVLGHGQRQQRVVQHPDQHARVAHAVAVQPGLHVRHED